MIKKVLILFVVILFMAACEGPMGPMGPAGPAGPIGPTGPAGEDFEYFYGSSTVDSAGKAMVALPVGAGTYPQAPLITCYLGGSGLWLVIGTAVSAGGPTATMGWMGDHWIVSFNGGALNPYGSGWAGWTFFVVAAW